MLIKVFPCEPFDTNTYVAANNTSSEAVIIDPGLNSYTPVCTFLKSQNLKPVAVLLTHTHWDHIVDASQFKDSGLPVYVHPLDAPNLIQPGADRLPVMFPIQGCSPDTLLNDGDTLGLAGIEFHVIHTPGHSPGGVCFYIPAEHTLFSGDTLFKGTIGNLSFPTSEPDKMWPSLNRLAKLPSSTKVYPGHGPSTTIGQESWLAKAQDYFGNI